MGRAASAGPGWAGPWRGLGGPSRALGGGFPAPGRGPGLRPALAQGLLSTNRSPGTPRITSAQLLSPCCRRARLSSLSGALEARFGGAALFCPPLRRVAVPSVAARARRGVQGRELAGGCRGSSPARTHSGRAESRAGSMRLAGARGGSMRACGGPGSGRRSPGAAQARGGAGTGTGARVGAEDRGAGSKNGTQLGRPLTGPWGRSGKPLRWGRAEAPRT